MCVSLCMCVRVCARTSVCVCLTMYNKAHTQSISNCELNLWTFLQGIEPILATFHAETCIMSHQSPRVLAEWKY